MSEQNGSVCPVDRRTALKSLSASTIGLLFAGDVAGSTSGKQKFVGIAYDTRTHEVTGKASADLFTDEDEIQGVIHLPEMSIPVSTRKSTTFNTRNTVQREFVTKKSGRFKLGEKPLDVQVATYNHGVSGYVSYPRADRGRLGFVLAHPKDIRSVSDLTAGLDGGETEKTGNTDERGIPITTTDTSSDGVETLACNVDDRDADETANSDSVGTLGANDTWDLMDWQNACDDTRIQSDWKYELNFHAEDRPDIAGSPEFNEIPDGSESLTFINSGFSNAPENLTLDGGMGWASSVRFDMRGGTGTKDSQRLKFRSPYPTESTDTSDISYSVQLNAGIDVFDPIPFLTMGMGIQAGYGPNGVSLDRAHQGYEQDEWLHWEMNLDPSNWRDTSGEAGVPLTPDQEETIGVYSSVFNNYSGNACETIFCGSDFTFGYESFYPDSCDESTHYTYYKDTEYISDEADVWT